MVRVARVLFLVLAAIIGLGGPSSASSPDSVAPVMASYTYDSHPRPAVLTPTASERGPPATYDRVTTYNAVDPPRHGASAHLSRDGAIAYDDLAQLALAAGTTATTQEQAQVANVDLDAFDLSSVAAKGAPELSQILMRSPGQLQSKFKHAGDFGVTGNYSKANAAKFSSAIHQHINSSGVRTIQGTYHKQPVTHYLDPSTGLNVIADRGGMFISGWKLSPGQLSNVLSHGGL